MFPVFIHSRQIAAYRISTNIHVLSLQIDITIFQTFSRYYSCYRCEKRVAIVLNMYDLVKRIMHMVAIQADSHRLSSSLVFSLNYVCNNNSTVEEATMSMICINPV